MFVCTGWSNSINLNGNVLLLSGVLRVSCFFRTLPYPAGATATTVWSEREEEIQKSVTLVRDIRIVGVRVVLSSFKHFGLICLTSSVHTGKKKKNWEMGREWNSRWNSFQRQQPCLVWLIYSPFSLLLLSHRPWEQLLFQSCIVRVYIDGRPARPCWRSLALMDFSPSNSSVRRSLLPTRRRRGRRAKRLM